MGFSNVLTTKRKAESNGDIKFDFGLNVKVKSNIVGLNLPVNIQNLVISNRNSNVNNPMLVWNLTFVQGKRFKSSEILPVLNHIDAVICQNLPCQIELYCLIM